MIRCVYNAIIADQGVHTPVKLEVHIPSMYLEIT